MKVYEIKKDRIIFYAMREDFFGFGIVFTLCIYLILIPFLISTNKANDIEPLYFYTGLLAPLGILALSIYLGIKTQIIVDTTERLIIKKNLFGYKEITSLENIHKIELSEFIHSKTRRLYKLILSDDIYGHGIHLTAAYKKNSKQLQDIYDNAISKIEVLLRNKPHKINRDKRLEQKIQLLSETRSGYYTYKERNTSTLLYIIIALILFPYLIVQGLTSYHLFIFIAIYTLALIKVKRKVEIDIQNQTIETSIYGLFKSKCLLSEVSEITPYKCKTRWVYSSTNIFVTTNREKKPYSIYLINIKDTKKVALFINDLNILLTPYKQ